MEAPFNDKEEIIIDDVEGFVQKLKQFISDGIEKIQLITDFDMTLTRREVGDTKGVTWFTAMQKSDFLSEEYRVKNKENYEIYRPYEKNITMDPDEKYLLMEKWWKDDMRALTQEHLTHDKFVHIAKNCDIFLKNGIVQLMKNKLKHKFPMIIVSAGIGELIKETFNLLFENHSIDETEVQPFNIVSNLGVFEEGELVEFQKPIIHIMNKSTHVKRFVDEQYKWDEENKCDLRKNIIVMGDVIEDLNMISEISYDNIIKIGFLNNPDSIDKYTYLFLFYLEL